jgi:hypothetical protein
MSNKEAKNKPGLSPVKRRYYGLYGRCIARNQFPRLSAVKEPLPCYNNMTPMETELPFPEKMIYSFIHSYLSQYTDIKEFQYETRSKHTVTVHWVPRRRKAYIQLDVVWFNKEIV